MCGPFGPFLLGSFWWIFPLAGMLMCLAFAIFAFRFASAGEGFMCMGGHQGGRKHQAPETRG